MKTPREIILHRHQNAEAKLDALRQRILSGPMESSAVEQMPAANDGTDWSDFMTRFWQELIWSCRRVWLGLGAAWVVILTVQFLAADASVVVKSEPAPLSPSVLEIFREQRRLAAELDESVPLFNPREPRNGIRPRTERAVSRPAYA